LLFFDPVVFRNTQICAGPYLSEYAIFAYLAIGLGAFSLVVWLLAATLREKMAPLMAGVMLTGALFALGLGIILLPISVLGLLAVIGVVGFIPLLTAFVYWRNGIRALRKASAAQAQMSRVLVGLIAGSVLVLAIPTLAQAAVSNVIQQAMPGILDYPASPDPA